MDKTISRRFFVLNAIFGCFCRGQIKLVPTDVPWENEQWTLQCSVNPIESVVTIKYPDSSAAGNCEPANTFLPAKCTPSVGNIFAINETTNTVSMTRTIVNSDTGTWTCVYSGNSTPYSLSSPLPKRTLPTSSPIYEMHAMTAKAGSELTSDTEHSFYFHYGCVSTNLKFVWTTVPGSSLSDTSNINSTSLACTTNSAYMSTLATNAAILKSVTSSETKLKVSVYVDGYDNLAVEEYTYNVTFSPGQDTTTVHISTATTDEQTTSVKILQTTESTTEKKTIPSTSFYAMTEVTLSKQTFSVYNGENKGEDNYHLIPIISICSVGAVLVIMAIRVTVLYRNGRLPISKKRNKYAKYMEDGVHDNNILPVQHINESTLKKDFNIERERPGNKTKTYDSKMNANKGLKKMKDNNKTKNSCKCNDGRISRNDHDLELSKMVYTQRNKRDSDNCCNDFRRYQQDGIYMRDPKLDNHHKRPIYANRSDSMYSYRPNDRSYSNTLHPMSSYMASWSDNTVQYRQQPYSLCSNDWY